MREATVLRLENTRGKPSLPSRAFTVIHRPYAATDQPLIKSAMNTDTADAQPYLLFFRNTGPENHARLSADERQKLVTRWNEWFETLLASGKATEGQPLEAETRVVTAGRVTDGPFAEAKEAVGGYVKLLVRDFDEAVAIARRHPGLEYGLIIEVRRMTADCHLGVKTKTDGKDNDTWEEVDRWDK